MDWEKIVFKVFQLTTLFNALIFAYFTIRYGFEPWFSFNSIWDLAWLFFGFQLTLHFFGWLYFSKLVGVLFEDG